MSLFGWSLPPGCSQLPHDEYPPEECPMCGADNCTDSGDAVFPDSPDFCSAACDEKYKKEMKEQDDAYAAQIAEEDAIAAQMNEMFI